MHTAHKIGNTARVSKLSSDWMNSTGFPGDLYVEFFNGLPGNKEEESRRFYNCDNECLPGSAKHLNLKSVLSSRHRLFKILPSVLHAGLLL